MKIGLINVGVNTEHRGLRSPIYDKGTFEFVPIPLCDSLQEYHVFPRYRDLLSPSGRAFSEFVPETFLDLRTDNDPNFACTDVTLDARITYGDWPTRNSKAANLKRLDVGDRLFFLARLENWNHDGFSGKAGFFIVGFMEIERVFDEDELTYMAERRRFDEQFEIVKDNGHILMMKDFTDLWLEDHHPPGWKRSWVFLGSKKSKRFRYAVPFTWQLASEVLRDAKGNKLTGSHNQTRLQRIGSYTRTCRLIDDEACISRLWDACMHRKIHS